MEEARAIQIMHCKRTCDVEERYVLNHWSSNVEDIFTLADTLGLD